MKQYFIKNRILVLLAVIGIICSLIPISARVKAEENNKYYDLVLEYSSLRSMALQSEMTEGEWLDLFKELGIGRISLGESSPRKMSENPSIPVYSASLKEIKTSIGWQKRYPDAVAEWIEASQDLSNAIIATETKVDFEWVLEAIKERTESFKYESYVGEDGNCFIMIPMQEGEIKGEKMLDLCLGIWPETAELAENHGYQIIPRTCTIDGLNGACFAQSFIKTLKEHNAPYFINTGDSLLGYDSEEGKQLLKDYLNETKTPSCYYEQNDQSQNLVFDGVPGLLEDTDYRCVRFFNEWGYIQYRYAYCGYEGPEEITNSLFRAIAERNCKAVLFRMILEPDNDVSVDADESEWVYITEPEDYRKLITDLNTRLSALGYKNQIVPPMELKNPSAIILLAEALGISALWVLLADLFLFLEKKWKYLLCALFFCTLAALSIVKTNGFKLILSMAGGIVMPILAAFILMRYLAEKRKSEKEISLGRLTAFSLIAGLAAVLVSFAGSLLASSVLSELSYILEINLYRGVKLMQLIPMGLFGLAYILVFAYEETGAKKALISNIGEKGEKGRIRKVCGYVWGVLDRPMRLSWFICLIVIAIAGAFFMAAGIYYIKRTGNTMGVSSAELAFRNFLENTLVARPRTKELLIGWPCLMLFIWSLRRHMNFLPLCFGLGMCLGLTGIVNTFLHIRTPFLLSLLRTFWGILFGFIIGIICLIAAEFIFRFVRKLYYGDENA